MKPPRINQNALELTCAEIGRMVERGQIKGWQSVFELFFGLTWEEAWLASIPSAYTRHTPPEVVMENLGNLLGSKEIVVGEDGNLYLNSFLYEVTDETLSSNRKDVFWNSEREQYIKRKKGVVPVFISQWGGDGGRGYYLIFVDSTNQFISINLFGNTLKWENSTLSANYFAGGQPLNPLNTVEGGWSSDILMIFEPGNFTKSFNFPQGGVL